MTADVCMVCFAKRRRKALSLYVVVETLDGPSSVYFEVVDH